jgi:hypothetical protein
VVEPHGLGDSTGAAASVGPRGAASDGGADGGGAGSLVAGAITGRGSVADVELGAAGRSPPPRR